MRVNATLPNLCNFRLEVSMRESCLLMYAAAAYIELDYCQVQIFHKLLQINQNVV